MPKARLRQVELAPLSLERYWLEDFSYQGDSLAKPDSVEVKISRPEVLRNESDPLHHLIRLRVRAIYPTGQAIDATIAGTFEFDADEAAELGVDRVHRMFRYSGPTILYGILRGIVAGLTAHSREGSCDLPAVNLAELMER